jgi:hypothetical protein
MYRKIFALIMASSAFFGSAEAATLTAPTNVSGNVVSTCQMTTTPVSFGTISIPVGGSATTSASFVFDCTGATTILLYPDVIGSALWSGAGRNVSSNGQKLYLTLTADGVPLPISGLSIFNSGIRQTVVIQAKVTPETSYSGSFNENIIVTAVTN